MSGAPSAAAAPSAAVRAWWQAMAAQDLGALEALTLPDYIASGGPDGREVGRDALLDGAAGFFAEAAIEDWALDDLEVRDHGTVAVCAYRWSEQGRHAGRPFALSGVATDVLVRHEGRWRLQAHHVSMGAPSELG